VNSIRTNLKVIEVPRYERPVRSQETKSEAIIYHGINSDPILYALLLLEGIDAAVFVLSL
jgi:hypothetical protein